MNKLYKLTLFSIFFVPLFGTLPFWLGLFKLRVGLMSGDIWYYQYIALLYVLCMGMCVVLWKFNKWISLFTLLCVVSAICSIRGGILIFTQSPQATFVMLQICLGAMAIYGISKFTKKQRLHILYTLIAFTLLQGIWIVVQYFNIDPIFKGHGVYMTGGRVDDTVGFSGSHNQIGVYFATLAPICMNYFIWILPLVIFGLWNSTTTAAWISFIIVGLYLTWRKSKKWFTAFILLGLLCSAAFFGKFENISSASIKERFLLYKHTIKAVNTQQIRLQKENVVKILTCSRWYGYGIGKFMSISPHSQRKYLFPDCDYYVVDRKNPYNAPSVLNISLKGGSCPSHVYAHAHNDFIEAYFELGIIGGVLLFLILLDILIKYYKSKKTKILVTSFSCILAQGICALMVFTVHTPVNGMILIIMLGIFYGEVNGQTINK